MVKNIISIIAIIMSVVTLIISHVNIFEPKYVDSGKLFKEFKMSKELDQQLELITSERKKILDSLLSSLRQAEIYFQNSKTAEKIKQEPELKFLQENYLYKKREFEDENERLRIDYSSKVWSQLNELINQFGKKNNLKIILGANGEGNILFAEKELDITDNLIIYCNEKYEGN